MPYMVIEHFRIGDVEVVPVITSPEAYAAVAPRL
jgi:hypothetical protein